jgi:hypothetical protein
VPVGALPKVPGKRSSTTIPAYDASPKTGQKKVTKGFGKLAATGANAIPITMKKVGVGKNNNNNLDVEEDGQQEYVASDATFVSKSEKVGHYGKF